MDFLDDLGGCVPVLKLVFGCGLWLLFNLNRALVSTIIIRVRFVTCGLIHDSTLRHSVAVIHVCFTEFHPDPHK